MGKKSYEREDFFGNKYWEDENGNRIYEREDFFGNKYYEDQKGNRTYEREDFFGNKYREDSSGNREYEREDFFGNKYREDNKGNRTYEREDFFGNKYEEKDEGGCFLTTACVEHAGLPDDCPELQLMRKFRDEYIRLLPVGSNLIEDYYRTAPLIVQRIKSGSDTNAVFENLLSIIRSVVALIQAGRNSEALAVCKREFQILRERYRV